MRKWEEADRARVAEVTPAPRASQEIDVAILRAEKVFAKPGDKHRCNGSAPAVAAEEVPYFQAALCGVM